MQRNKVDYVKKSNSETFLCPFSKLLAEINERDEPLGLHHKGLNHHKGPGF